MAQARAHTQTPPSADRTSTQPVLCQTASGEAITCYSTNISRYACHDKDTHTHTGVFTEYTSDTKCHERAAEKSHTRRSTRTLWITVILTISASDSGLSQMFCDLLLLHTAACCRVPNLLSVQALYLSPTHDPLRKQRSFSSTALTAWHEQRQQRVLTTRYELYFQVNVHTFYDPHASKR